MNGRVDISTNDGSSFKSHDFYKNQDRKYKNLCTEAIYGIHANNDLARVFFSRQNMDALQQGIRYVVYKNTCRKHIIDNQSETELAIIMRSMYLQHGEHRPYGIIEQVKELNGHVIDFAVPKIIEEINMHDHYRKDVSALPVPMARGQIETNKGTRVLETKMF